MLVSVVYVRLLRPTLAREDLQYLRKKTGALRSPACDLFACLVDRTPAYLLWSRVAAM